MGIWKWGIYGLMGGWGGIYHLMGGTVMAKVSYFVWKYVKKMLVFGGEGGGTLFSTGVLFCQC